MSLFRSKKRDENTDKATFELFMNVISQPSLIPTDLPTSIIGTPYFLYMCNKVRCKGGRHE